MILAPLFDVRPPAQRSEGEKAPEAERRATQKLCEEILNALGRDERLRRDYLSRRWCGLIE